MRSNAALTLFDYGRLPSSDGCSRQVGRYPKEAQGPFNVNLADATELACPEALMSLERKLRKLLKISSHSLDAFDVLMMSTQAGKRIVARR